MYELGGIVTNYNDGRTDREGVEFEKNEDNNYHTNHAPSIFPPSYL